MAKTIEELQKEKQLLEEQASIQRTIFENDNRRTRALKESLDLEGKILELEDKIYKRSNDGLADQISLEKQIQSLKDGVVGTLSQQLGLDKQIVYLEELKTKGTKDQISNATKLTEVILGVQNGSIDVEKLTRMSADNFGDMGPLLEKIKQIMREFPDVPKESGLDAKIVDTVDDLTGGLYGTAKAILATAGPAGLLVAAIGAIAKLVIGFAKQTLEVRRNLGVSAGDALKLSGRMEAAALQTKLLGGDSEKAKELVTGLVTEFGNVEEASALSTKNIADLTTELGIGGGETAKLLKVLSDVSGESLDTLSSTLEFEASLARAEGIPVAKVMADVAQNADAFARAGADGADEVFRAARAAADLGTNLQTVEGVMDNLVDIEGSLTKEMEAEALIGRQLNLDRARQLAQANDQQGVIDEIIAQVGGPEAFARLGRIEQGALADVFGLSVGQLAPFLGANAGGGGGAVATPQVAKDSLTAANNTNDILSKEHGKNQERHEQLLGAVQDLTRATKRAYA